jgi:hypothetical protein
MASVSFHSVLRFFNRLERPPWDFIEEKAEKDACNMDKDSA